MGNVIRERSMSPEEQLILQGQRRWESEDERCEPFSIFLSFVGFRTP